ncbi:MAG: hypothetical protein Q9222_006447 [Ikaeria aurantiellina]
MKVEHDYGAHHGAEFDGGHWVHVADNQPPHQSPLHEFNDFYMSSPSHLEMGSFYSRPAVTSQPSNPPLYPLIVPQWPSQLTNPSISPPSAQPQSSLSAPAQTPRPIAPLTTPIDHITTPHSAPPAPVPTPIPTPPSGRRTLTDQDRRRMCQYHDENPTVKQTEIGSLFGVERSTVSKVLRHKEKYLHPDDGSRSPIKRAKGKFPDIERAVSNWAKNHQRQGLPLSNEMIRDKARIFATTVGSSDCISKVNSPIWLEKFKRRHGLLGASLPQPNDAEDSDMNQPNDISADAQSPHGISPISPTEQTPCSPDMEGVKQESADKYTNDSHPAFRRTHSESGNALGNYFTGTSKPATLSPDLHSPASPFFSPVASCGPSPSVPSQPPRLPTLAPADPRPRRQTFPTLGNGPSYISPPVSATAEPMSTSGLFQQSMATSTLSSPLEEMEDPSLSIDTAMHNHAATHTATNTPIINGISPSSMAPPPHPPPASSSPRNGTSTPLAASSPHPYPSQDEARQALQIVMNFFQSQPSAVDAQDYFTMGKLMEKLEVRNKELPGGMRSMMENSRKRGIHSLS